MLGDAVRQLWGGLLVANGQKGLLLAAQPCLGHEAYACMRTGKVLRCVKRLPHPHSAASHCCHLLCCNVKRGLQQQSSGLLAPTLLLLQYCTVPVVPELDQTVRARAGNTDGYKDDAMQPFLARRATF